jgi:hypothetical protein
MATRHVPKVFIMSSTPGRRVADPLAVILGEGGRIDATVWTDGFDRGETFLESLRRTTLSFDFGILVITPDDPSTVRGRFMILPRDNVTFELGLFYSALGPRRALPVVVTVDGKEPEMASDLLGVNRKSMSVSGTTDVAAQIRREAVELRDNILELHERPEYGLLPSTALAIGYFVNFVQPLAEGLELYPRLNIRGDTEPRQVEPDRWRLSICIPEDLSAATRERWASVANRLKLQQAEVAIPANAHVLRAYPFRVGVRHDGRVEIYDTPTTLRTAFDTIRKLMPHAAERHYRMAEARSVSDFEQTIRHMITDSGRAYLRDQVEIIYWDELASRYPS